MIVFPAFCKPFVCKATKIVKGERRGKRKTKFFKFDYPEPHPILSKDSERRAQYKKETCLIFLLPSRVLAYEKIVTFVKFATNFFRLCSIGVWRADAEKTVSGMFLWQIGSKIIVSISFFIEKRTIFEQLFRVLYRTI